MVWGRGTGGGDISSTVAPSTYPGIMPTPPAPPAVPEPPYTVAVIAPILGLNIARIVMIVAGGVNITTQMNINIVRR